MDSIEYNFDDLPQSLPDTQEAKFVMASDWIMSAGDLIFRESFNSAGKMVMTYSILMDTHHGRIALEPRMVEITDEGGMQFQGIYHDPRP